MRICVCAHVEFKKFLCVCVCVYIYIYLKQVIQHHIFFPHKVLRENLILLFKQKKGQYFFFFYKSTKFNCQSCFLLDQQLGWSLNINTFILLLIYRVKMLDRAKRMKTMNKENVRKHLISMLRPRREIKQKKINSQELDWIFPSSFDGNDEIGIFSPSLVDEVIFSPYIVFGF